MGTWIHDIRYSLRLLAHNPGFSTVVVITLALGVGVNAAMFSVINGVLLHPLPYKNPGQLVRIDSTDLALAINAVSPREFSEIKRQTNVFEGFAPYGWRNATLTGLGDPEEVSVTETSPAVFDVLGVRPVVGRTFLSEEAQTGRNYVALIGASVWEARFNSDPRVLGRSLDLGDKAYTIVGVLPAGFRMPEDFGSAARPTVCVPLVAVPEGSRNYNVPSNPVVARLRRGASIAEAQTQLHRVAQRLAQMSPDTNKDRDFTVRSLDEFVVGKVRRGLLVLSGAVVLVLLIACVNIANLVLARGAGRHREIALRESLGASRLRVIRQLVTESLLLSLVGGFLGLFGAAWGVRLLIALAPANTPRLEAVRVDVVAVGFAFVVSALAGTLFGLFPAVPISKPDLSKCLKEGGASSEAGLGSMRRHRTRSLLVVSETALATVLLVGAGLLIRSLWKLTTVDRGFDSSHLLVVRVDPTARRLNKPAQVIAFYDEVLPRVRALPGVRAACVTSASPLLGAVGQTFFNSIQGQPVPPEGRSPWIQSRAVSPGYFRAVGQHLLAGREFTDQDNGDVPGVLIVSEGFALRFLPDQNPIGKHLMQEWVDNKPAWEIVGVVSNVRDVNLSMPSQPEIFFSYRQFPFGGMYIVVRTLGKPLEMAPLVRDQIWDGVRDRPTLEIATVDQSISKQLTEPRFRAAVLTAFAGLALVLALVGIYGVTSYGVARRTHEFGIRMALGATPWDVVRSAVGSGAALTFLGVALGLAGSFALTRVLASMLYGIGPTDLATFAGVGILFTGVAMLACYFPARRATKVDPMEALRYE